MEKLKILGILPFNRLWYTKTGGTPTLYNLIKGFIDAGHEVHLVCLFDKEEDIFLKDLYVHRFKLPLNNFKSNIKVLNGIYSKILYFLFILIATCKALKITRKMKPDIIYGFAGSGAAAAYLVAKIRNIPNITRLFGTFLYPFIQNHFQLLLRFDEVLAFKIPCEYLIITNDGTKGDEVAKQLGVSVEKLKFWFNGVDKLNPLSNEEIKKIKKKMNIKKSDFILLTVSRLVQWKRVDRTIKALKEIIPKYNNIKLVIVGYGREIGKLKKLVEDLNLEDKIKFAGSIPYKDINKFYSIADIFISMYNISNVGNPLLEAMSFGLPIITLGVGGTEEIIIDKENGILIPFSENENEIIESLSREVINLISNEPLRKKLGMNAKEFVNENFLTWEERINMEIKEINKLIR